MISLKIRFTNLQ